MSVNNNDISDLRKTKYRNLLDEIEVINEGEENICQNPELIDEILNAVDNLLHDGATTDKLGHTDEFVLDATLIEKANNILHKITHTIVPVIDNYNPSDFGAKLRHILSTNETLQNDQLEWANLFEISRTVLKVVPSFSYMCGFERTEEDVQKEKKPRERRENKNVQEATRQPERLANVRKEEDSIDDTVKFIFWALNKEYRNNGNEPINYFTFAMDPNSFVQTVENCFHLSFLIRDARVDLSANEYGMFVLSPVSSKESKRSEHNKQFQQYILSLDTSVWERAVRMFNIQSSPLTKWRSEWEEKKKQK